MVSEWTSLRKRVSTWRSGTWIICHSQSKPHLRMHSTTYIHVYEIAFHAHGISFHLSFPAMPATPQVWLAHVDANEIAANDAIAAVQADVDANSASIQSVLHNTDATALNSLAELVNDYKALDGNLKITLSSQITAVSEAKSPFNLA